VRSNWGRKIDKARRKEDEEEERQTRIMRECYSQTIISQEEEQ